MRALSRIGCERRTQCFRMQVPGRPCHPKLGSRGRARSDRGRGGAAPTGSGRGRAGRERLGRGEQAAVASGRSGESVGDDVNAASSALRARAAESLVANRREAGVAHG